MMLNRYKDKRPSASASDVILFSPQRLVYNFISKMRMINRLNAIGCMLPAASMAHNPGHSASRTNLSPLLRCRDEFGRNSQSFLK